MVWILSSKVTSHIWQQKPEVLLLCQVLLEPNQRLHHHWFFWEHANTFRRLLKYAINHELERKKSYYRSSVKILVLPTMPASYNQQFFFSIQTNLVWLNVESPNSGSWRIQQKKENWFSWKMVYYELRPTTTREEAYKVTLISFRIKPSL